MTEKDRKGKEGGEEKGTEEERIGKDRKEGNRIEIERQATKR